MAWSLLIFDLTNYCISNEKLISSSLINNKIFKYSSFLFAFLLLKMLISLLHPNIQKSENGQISISYILFETILIFVCEGSLTI